MIRPLGGVSDFVVLEMPRLLREQDKKVILWRIVHILSELDERFLREVKESGDRAIAALDLKMIEAACVHSGIPVIRDLCATTNALIAYDETPALTYGDLVLTNPQNDLRRFTDGEVGETEGRFYNAHREIEGRLTAVIDSLDGLLSVLESGGSPDGLLSVSEMKAALMVIVRSFKSEGLTKMPAGHFNAFRAYLHANPVRNTKGASGAFSAQMPILEVLFRNGAEPPNFISYILDNWKYFPTEHKPRLKKALEEARKGRTLLKLLEGVPLSNPAHQYAEVLHRFFFTFRKAHLLAVKTQMPGKAGTGGEDDPVTFLEGRTGPRDRPSTH